jgi:hypothetical protein
MAGGQLAEQFINYAFRDLIEKRKWSWSIAQSQFVFPAAVTTGTVTVVNNSNAVVGLGTAWTTAMIGRQFRTSTLTPVYTIIAVGSPTTLTLDQPWGAASASAQGYKIYIAYQIPPTDFHAFTTVWDANFSWSLWTDMSQAELNTYDAQRAAQGTPYVVADFDYTNLAFGGGVISPQVPRFEIWPHQISAYVIPFMYEKRFPDLNDSNGELPRFIPGNVLLEGGLAALARWPGPDAEHRNPYFSIQLAQMHQTLFDKAVRELQVQDDNVYGRDVTYGQQTGMAFCPYPFPVNSAYIQLHAI